MGNFFSNLPCFVPVIDLFVLLPGTENICGYMVCGYMLFLPSLFSLALFDLFSWQPKNRLMGIFFVDWNLVGWNLVDLFSRQPRNRLMLFFVDWNFQIGIYSGLNLAMNGL